MGCRMARVGLLSAFVLVVFVVQGSASVEGTSANPALDPRYSEVERSAAAWHRIAVLTVQMDAALEALVFEHRCRPYGSVPLTNEQALFGTFAMHEALTVARLMWPHVRTLSPLLSRYYWPLRFRLAQIAWTSADERTELVCRPDFHHIRSRWNLALSGSVLGVEPPFEWPEVQRLGVLRRMSAAYDRAVSTTCHSLEDPHATVTSSPAELKLLKHSLAVSKATARVGSTPKARDRGAVFLWQANQGALAEWTSDLERSLQDGVRRHVCGHLLYSLLRGAYYTWLNQTHDQIGAMRLDQVLQWTQLEVSLRQICDYPQSPASPLVIHGISRFVSPVRTVVSLPVEFRPRRDEIAVAVQEWLPEGGQVSLSQFDVLTCPEAHLKSLSSFLTDLAALAPTD